MSGRLQRQLRQFHRYCSVFFAPSILFFALSGLLQTVRLNDATPAGPAPAWIKWMAAIHKDQEPPRVRKPRPAAPVDAKKAPPREAEEAPKFVPLKIFVLLSLGLIFSTVLGLCIALMTAATRRVSAIVLAAGVTVPVMVMTL